MPSVDELSASDLHLFNNASEPAKPARTIALRVNGAFSPSPGATITVRLRANGMEIVHAGVPNASGRFNATFTVDELNSLNLTANSPAKIVVEVTSPAFVNDAGVALVATAARNFVFA